MITKQTFKIDKSLGLKAAEVIVALKTTTQLSDLSNLESLFCTNPQCLDSHIILKVTYNAGLRERKRKHK